MSVPMGADYYAVTGYSSYDVAAYHLTKWRVGDSEAQPVGTSTTRPTTGQTFPLGSGG